MLQIDTAELAGLAAEGVLFGIFICLFCVCGYDLVDRRKRLNTQLSWPMVLAGVLLIILAIVRFFVDCSNIFVAFIRHDPREARLAYLEDVTQPLFITKHCIFITALLVGDSFVNYRCWVVWGKKIWIVIPTVILSFISTGSGAYTMWAYGHLPNQTIRSQSALISVLFSLSLVTNALATSLLAYRIWSIDRKVKASGARGAPQSRLNPVVRIVMESGLANAAYLFVFVMTLEFGSQALEIMSEMAVPLTGIIFSIVILRVGHQSHGDSFYASQPAPNSIAWPRAKSTIGPAGGRTGTSATTTAGNTSSMPMEIFVHDTTTTTKGYDDDSIQRLESRSLPDLPAAF
ncbi:hypothetical protein TRAPUB_13753 [Trametes pubescens]|uniref:Uncharacterized protein n=1 Tax=Trametes pubescens TaxID=154538 RepID=A0A1M2VQB0_TRAPU|nr:hypothetical protein TRAPUB_13753 [Trametes pubescens]